MNVIRSFGMVLKYEYNSTFLGDSLYGWHLNTGWIVLYKWDSLIITRSLTELDPASESRSQTEYHSTNEYRSPGGYF